MTTGEHGRRLRVLIAGSSVGYYVRPPLADDAEQAVDGWLERLLGEAGIDAEVRNDSRWFDTVADGYRRLPQRLAWFRPDVIVLLYGYIESQPYVCPRWFAKWLFHPQPRSDRLSTAIRSRAIPRARRLFLRSAPRVAAVPRLPSRVGPGRVRTEVRRYADLAHKERRAVVLCANVPDTDQRIETTLPTTRARLAATSEAIERAAGDLDGVVHLVDLRAMVSEAGADRVLPDGIHLSAAGHRLLAERLALKIRAMYTDHQK